MDIFLWKFQGRCHIGLAELNIKGKEPVKELSVTWDSWTGKWTHVWEGQMDTGGRQVMRLYPDAGQ